MYAYGELKLTRGRDGAADEYYIVPARLCWRPGL
jgi:hypothetical protein